MRKIIAIAVLLSLVLPFIALHCAFVRSIKSGRSKIAYGPSSDTYVYDISSAYPSGFKFFDYLPGGENTFDVGIGLIRLPLIRYTVTYSAVVGKSDPSIGPVVESQMYMSYFPIKIASYY